MDTGWGKLKWWTGSAKGSWRCRSRGVWEDSSWKRGLHKRMGTSLQAAKRAQVGNISRVNISCRKRCLNDNETDNMQNYYRVLIRRISDTKKWNSLSGKFVYVSLKDRLHVVNTTGWHERGWEQEDHKYSLLVTVASAIKLLFRRLP